MSAAQQGGGELPQDERAALENAISNAIYGWGEMLQDHNGAVYEIAKAVIAQRAASVPAQAGQEVPVELVDAIVHTGRRYGNSETFRPQIESLLRHFWPAASVQPEFTYSSTQATNCACCGKHKHTPLRVDAMGGYVCLTCIDQKLCSLLEEFGYPQPDIGRDAALVAQGRAAGIEACARVVESGDVAGFNILIKEALATQAAPEVASVPDAGDEPVAIRWPDGRGRYHFADVSDTVTQDALSKSEDLYTRPQPAPAVLSDEQIVEIAGQVFNFKHWKSDEENKAKYPAFFRAVLAAANK